MVGYIVLKLVLFIQASACITVTLTNSYAELPEIYCTPTRNDDKSHRFLMFPDQFASFRSQPDIMVLLRDVDNNFICAREKNTFDDCPILIHIIQVAIQGVHRPISEVMRNSLIVGLIGIILLC